MGRLLGVAHHVRAPTHKPTSAYTHTPHIRPHGVTARVHAEPGAPLRGLAVYVHNQHWSTSGPRPHTLGRQPAPSTGLTRKGPCSSNERAYYWTVSQSSPWYSDWTYQAPNPHQVMIGTAFQARPYHSRNRLQPQHRCGWLLDLLRCLRHRTPVQRAE